jgi:hypothetical protein
MISDRQIEALNAIAAECHERDPECRDRLSVSDFADWAAAFDAADLPDLADRVRACDD